MSEHYELRKLADRMLYDDCCPSEYEEELRAILSHFPDPPATDEVTAWLIEDPTGHPHKFWLPNGKTGIDWTDDANAAVRFLRHNDANAVIAVRPNMDELWVAREHVWIGDHSATDDDIDADAEEAADKAGVYGAGPEFGDHPDDCKCRMCFVTQYREDHNISKSPEKHPATDKVVPENCSLPSASGRQGPGSKSGACEQADSGTTPSDATDEEMREKVSHILYYNNVDISWRRVDNLTDQLLSLLRPSTAGENWKGPWKCECGALLLSGPYGEHERVDCIDPQRHLPVNPKPFDRRISSPARGKEVDMTEFTDDHAVEIDEVPYA